MPALDTDTIVAIATPPGRGGIGIVRLSGNRSLAIAEEICSQKLQVRHAHFSHFYSPNGSYTIIDSGLAIYFPGPASFTGEDVVELHGHGGPVIMDLLVKSCTALGARQARAGEFSERAYLNDKIDLTQAEAIADLINSTTEAAALSANRSLQGEFAKAISELVDSLIALRVYVEAAIDFPEEEIDFLEEGGVHNRLLDLLEQVNLVLETASRGSLLSEGIRLVIAGKPNAGKSSLLNALSGEDRAIVTSIAGTTRDVLRADIQIDGLPVHVIDTAGLRTDADLVEMEGIKRAWAEIETADHVLIVRDSGAGKLDENIDSIAEIRGHLPSNTSVTLVDNKCDLSGLKAGPIESTAELDETIIRLSAKTGEGVESLRQHLKQDAGFISSEAGQFSARRRHLDALTAAKQALETGIEQLSTTGAGELLAEDLRVSQHHLEEITGVFTSDELLGEIFSGFCIGK